MSTIIFDDRSMRRWLDKAIKKSPSDLELAIKNTTAETLVITKKTLPKRTGLLRKAYLSRKLKKYSYEIFPGRGDALQYAEAIESGSRAHTIVPRNAKKLTIPLRDDVLVGSKARISSSALNRLFRALKNRKGRTNREIYEEVGIALADKANIPAQPGQWNIRDRIAPKSQKILKRRVTDVYKKLGFR